MDSRTKNSSRNMIFASMAYIIQVVLGFLVRRYFLHVFNAEYLGINSLFTNVLSVLSLAELGFGSALVFAMYKPMADGDKEKVRQLLHFYKTSYTIIGCVILGLGLCVLPFMDYFKAQAPNTDVNLYLVYIIFLITNVVSYFFAYRRSLLYTSQRNDIESKVGMGINLLSTLMQLTVVLVFKNYYLYILVSLITTLLSNLIIYFITQRKYTEFVKKPREYLDKASRKAINKNIFALIFHKVGSVVVFSTDSIIIYVCLNAVTLGMYSNYLLITTYVSNIILLFANAMRGSVGNSIAKEEVEINRTLLNKLNFIYFWLVSFCTIAIFVLADPFISTILGDGSEVLNLDALILVLICVNFYFSNTRYLTGMFKECAGLFYQDRFKSLIEAIINLVTSIILVNLIGLPGVIIGTIISTLTTSLWIEPYVLHKHYFKKSMSGYWIKYLIYTISMLIAGMGTYLICGLLPTGGVGALILKFAVCAVVPNVILLACLFWMPEFRECVKWGIGIIKGFKNKRKNEVVVNNVDEGVLLNPVDLDKDGIIDITVSIPATIMEHEKQNESITENIQDVVIAENVQNKSNETDEN